MTKGVHSVVCDLCGSADQQRLPYAYPYKSNHLFLVQCRDCGLRFVNPRPFEEALLDLYSNEYFQKDYVCGLWEGDYVSNRDKLLQEAHEVLNLVSSHGVTKGFLLDVGCAGGYFLTAARQRGFEVAGVEINREMAEFVSQQGHKVHRGTLESAQFRQDCFDVVVLCDVLEHVPSPRHLLMEVRRILKSDGYLYIRGPMDATLAGRIFRMVRMVGGRGVRDLPGNPYHLYEFTPRTLKAYLNMAGFVTAYVRTAESFEPGKIINHSLSIKVLCELIICAMSKCTSLFPSTRMGDFIEILAKKQPVTFHCASY